MLTTWSKMIPLQEEVVLYSPCLGMVPPRPGPFSRRRAPQPGGIQSWKPTGSLSSTPRPPIDLHLIRMFF